MRTVRNRERRPDTTGPLPVTESASKILALRPSVSPLDTLGPALDALPTAAHRAFLRLLLDAVVARRHRRHAYPSGWPSFAACGPIKTGKSLLVAWACLLIGADPARVVRSVPAETERSLYGRRHQLPGGAWALRPSPLLGEPLLALDELDKAPRDVQRACLKLLQGEARIGGEEGEIIEVAPVVVVLANGFPGQLPPEYRRCSVVLDTSGLVAELGNIYAAAGTFLEAIPAGFDLDVLAVPVGALAVPVVDQMAAALRSGLSEAGWRLCDERALAHLVPGRVALSGLDVPSSCSASSRSGCATLLGTINSKDCSPKAAPQGPPGATSSPPSRVLASPTHPTASSSTGSHPPKNASWNSLTSPCHGPNRAHQAPLCAENGSRPNYGTESNGC